jgi:hypothetical protein
LPEIIDWLPPSAAWPPLGPSDVRTVSAAAFFGPAAVAVPTSAAASAGAASCGDASRRLACLGPSVAGAKRTVTVQASFTCRTLFVQFSPRTSKSVASGPARVRVGSVSGPNPSIRTDAFPTLLAPACTLPKFVVASTGRGCHVRT